MREDVSIIQGWMYHGNLIASLIRLFKRKSNLLWSVRQTLGGHRQDKFFTKLVVRLARLFTGYVSVTIYNSNVSLREHRDLLGYDTPAICIDNGYCDKQWIYSSTNRSKYRRKLKIPLDSKVVMFIGRNHPQKGIPILLEAFESMNSLIDNNYLVLMGKGFGLDQGLLEFTPSSNFGPNVIFVSEKRDVEKWISIADFVCLPSVFGEAFPNVVAESMCASVPCIATDIGETSRIIGDCGWVVNPNDVDGIRSALTAALSLEPGPLKRLRQQCRKRIIENFSQKANVTKFEELYSNFN